MVDPAIVHSLFGNLKSCWLSARSDEVAGCLHRVCRRASYRPGGSDWCCAKLEVGSMEYCLRCPKISGGNFGHL